MILFITRKYPPSVGGMQRLSYRLTTEISQLTSARILSWGRGQWGLLFFVGWSFVRAVPLLLKDNVRLIHIGDPVLTPIGLLLGALGHVPVVVTAHGLDVTYSHPLYQAMLSALLPRVDRVVCISHYTRDECVRKGIPPDRCVVIPPGVDSDASAAIVGDEARRSWARSLGFDATNMHLLLTVGRLVSRKGVAPFVREALPLLLERRRDWLYVVVGDGPERSTVESAARSAVPAGHVRLLGSLSDADVRTAYTLADAFVMPNVAIPGDPEGFGLVALEARAAGVPVVATAVQGIPDAVGGPDDGTLIASGDWGKFVDAICDQFDRHETPAQREERRQRVLTSHSWSHVALQYVDVFREVMEAHPAQRRRQPANRN